MYCDSSRCDFKYKTGCTHSLGTTAMPFEMKDLGHIRDWHKQKVLESVLHRYQKFVSDKVSVLSDSGEGSHVL